MEFLRISSGSAAAVRLVFGYILNSVDNRIWDILSISSLNVFDFTSAIITNGIAITFFTTPAIIILLSLQREINKNHPDCLFKTSLFQEVENQTLPLPAETPKQAQVGFDSTDFQKFRKETLFQRESNNKLLKEEVFDTQMALNRLRSLIVTGQLTSDIGDSISENFDFICDSPNIEPSNLSQQPDSIISAGSPYGAESIDNQEATARKITIYLNCSAPNNTNFYVRGDACSLSWDKEGAQQLTFEVENQWKWETDLPDKKFSFKFLRDNEVWEIRRWNNELTREDCKMNQVHRYFPEFP